jgi:putative sigma-54 modulation protein
MIFTFFNCLTKKSDIMKITIQTAGVTPHEPLERIEKKLSKLETFYDKIVESAVYLKVENTSEKKIKQ